MFYTQEGSGKLADEWWRKKFAELTGDPAREQRYQQFWEDKKKRQQEDHDAFQAAKPVIKKLFAGEPLALISEVDAIPIAGRAVDKNKRLKHHTDNFLTLIEGRSKASTYREVRDYIHSLEKVWSPDFDITAIDESKVDEVFLLLKRSSLSQVSKKKRWAIFKRFVDYLAERAIIPAPRNLRSKMTVFKVGTSEVKRYDLDHVRKVLANLKPRLRLYALLGLNASMTNADIGSLTKDMIVGNVLTKRRVKTGQVKTVPTVRYTLWPETMDLLEEFKSDHPTLWLTGKSGESLWDARMDGSAPKKKDMIVQQWRRAKCGIPLKAFRSIAATEIESHVDYGRLTQLFLGHAPATIASKHYAGSPDVLFQKCLTWLRTRVLEG
jgi:integrase